MIPATQLLHRHAKPVRYRNQRIAATYRVPSRTNACSSVYHRNDQFISRLDIITGLDLIRFRNIVRVCMKLCRDPFQRFTFAHHVKAPTASLPLRNIFHSCRKRLLRPHGNVQIEIHIGRCAHP
jgi:hypothetical protein